MKKNKDAGFESEKRDFSLFPGILLAVLGVIFMALGIWRGEMAVVFQKAVNICMECIGIG